jgi:cytochrome oxidase Cu insertion factor (SCO1/SenC/PrrC family)
MNAKHIVFIAIILCVAPSLSGQNNKRKALIIADVGSFPESQTISTKESLTNIEVFISKPTGNAVDPKSDSTKLPWIIYKPIIKDNRYTIVFEISEPTKISSVVLPDKDYLVMPGDSIFIHYNGTDYVFSGKGVEKYQLLHEIEKAKSSITRIVPANLAHISLEEYLKFNQYFDKQLNKLMPIIETCKPRLNEEEYQWIKAWSVFGIEYSGRLQQFKRLNKGKNIKRFNNTHTSQDICNVWDSTMYKPWGKWIRSQNFPFAATSYVIDFTNNELLREIKFTNNDSLVNSSTWRKLLYSKIRNNPDYTGLFRERALIYELNDDITKELGAYNWIAQSILRDYYSQPGFPAYKEWIRSLEKSRQYLNKGNKDVPLFELMDEHGKNYSSKDIKGKLAIVSFWYSGCEECKQIVPSLARLQSEFKKDTNILFLNISVDIDKKTWLQNKDAGIYISKEGIQLFTGGQGKVHAILNDFNVIQYPTLRYIDGFGKMIIDPSKPFASIIEGEKITEIVRQELLRIKDGPYVLKINDQYSAFTISGNTITEQKDAKELFTTTDQPGKYLPFSLQKQTTVPPSEYPSASKILALSDIEGNFSAFRKLLQANGVIDHNFNWIFGNGHLVFAGDMFDRGEQVTQCLWLIYSLEEKAKSAGGYVHFVLGNHEIMNLNGDDGYAENKYKKNYALLGKTLQEIYSQNSELGAWLRSKNIIEKIGDNLFVHGGISPHVNNIPLSLEQINTLARPYYDKSEDAQKAPNSMLNILFNARKSPFWYRQYYANDYFSKSNNELIYHATEAQLDSTLRKFHVNHVITGHTIVADTITIHYGGKVINTDTHHATGKSEALLIEKDDYYRVSDKGSKALLFRDKKHTSSDVAGNN